MRKFIAAFALGAALLGSGAPAHAQGYNKDQKIADDDVVKPGQSVKINVGGFKPNSEVTITIESEPRVLGTFTADANGFVVAEVTIPADMPFGAHTLKVTGVDAAGNPLVVSQAIIVNETGDLAETGADTFQLLLAGGAIATVGAGAVVAGRKRTKAAA